MEMERPHRTANNSSSSSSDLFVCFTSRFCSFSHREQPKLSSSSSLTRRRLRTSGSIKGGGGGGQSSPMLILTGSKKIRGGSYSNGFENHPEPSSPKVTCIGQVRVKTRKKQGGRCCTRRRRKNQKWVQLPSTICEGLRAFGADLNCFLPCGGGRSLCSSSSVSERDGTGKRRGGSGNGGNGSCGAVFARWVMALQEEEDEGEGEERRKMDMRVRDEEVVQGELEIKKMEEVVMLKEEDVDDGKEESERISVCIPPRNALLLMRCRSDPVRIAALAANNHYFWEESFVSNNQDDNDDDHSEEEENEEEEEGEVEVEEDDDGENDEKKTQVCDEQVERKLEQKEDQEETFFKWVVLDEALNDENSDNEDYPIKKEEEENELGCSESTRHEQEEKEDLDEEEGGKDDDDDDDDEIMVNWSLFESFYQVQSLESEEQKEEDMQEFEESSCESSEMQLQPPRDTELMILVGESQESKTEHRASEEDQTIHTHMTCTANDHHAAAQEQSTTKSEEEDQEQDGEEVQKSSVLPDCLLSMLYESKLSMEISKETWVCGNDFIRGKSNDQVSTFNGSNDIDDNKNRQADVMINGPDKAPTIMATQHDQPPRASFSNPTAAKASVPVPSMAALVMQKLMSAVAQEPFVLTRCKSEPPRPSARLVPEACSWKNQNLLLLRPSRRTGGPPPGAIGLLAQPKC